MSLSVHADGASNTHAKKKKKKGKGKKKKKWLQ
jgi:hypothetical protein